LLFPEIEPVLFACGARESCWITPGRNLLELPRLINNPVPRESADDFVRIKTWNGVYPQTHRRTSKRARRFVHIRRDPAKLDGEVFNAASVLTL
jgi:hypothetical protein